jgi:uncharacterized membrane protein
MKKIILLSCLSAAVVLLVNCHSGKKAQATVMQKFTFEGNVKMLVQTKCAPCHVNEAGRLPYYLKYDVAKNDIDGIIRRVHLNPGEKGFMPAKNAKLSDSAIHVFEQWKADGLMEK